MTSEEIIRIVNKEEIRFIRLQFTDIFGMMKNICIMPSQLESVIEKGRMFDGSSVEGFARDEESDMRLVPDLNTFCILPFSHDKGKIARIICDVYDTEGNPFSGDPRYRLKLALQHAAQLGYSIDIGPECEFFLFNTDEAGHAILTTNDPSGYFDEAPLDGSAGCRREICLALDAMGFVVEASHHENAPCQHEIDFRFCNALEAADKIMTLKLTAKSIASENGMYATFMPKPIYGMAGSGMHINISLSADGQNVTYGQEKGSLSGTALHFMGGLLRHARGFCAVTNPLINSYKRLVSGYEAPTRIAWSVQNRSPLIRVPYFTAKNARIELRNPDATCNPYLAIACIIESGLDGILHEMDPNDGIASEADSLPEDLLTALRCMKADAVVMNAIGSQAAGVFLRAKEKEWADYKTMVTSWEIDNYLHSY